MRSMTGYAHRTYLSEEYKIEVELKSYNSRFLEIAHSISPYLQKYEFLIDEKLKDAFKRGHIEVLVRCKIYKSNVNIALDENALDSFIALYGDIDKRVFDKTGVHAEIRISDFTSQEGVIVSERDESEDTFLLGLFEALELAIADLMVEREREGEGTKESLVALGNEIVSSLSFIEDRADTLESHFKEQLEKKYAELCGKEVYESPSFTEELGSLLVKYSINEEVSRLHVHLNEYFRLLEDDSPVGKRLDFIAQEMNRECNTIASKSQLAEINLSVVKMKDAIENIREQVRNVE